MTPRAVLERIANWMAGRGPRPAGARGAGWDWERMAEKTLVEAGYRILDRNFRAAAGELDFVAEEGGVLCFVEVKGRRGLGFGTPEEAVTPEKQRRMFRAAQVWLRRHRRGLAPCRFDVVSVREDAEGRRIEVLRDAFQGPTVRPRRR
jgi:putative endonuclease